MTRAALAAATALAGGLFATVASAGALDRSNQDISPIFDPSGTVGAQVTYVDPSLDGSDADGGDSYDAGEAYTTYQWSFVQRVNDRFSFGMIGDEPYGLNLEYDAPSGDTNLGGTAARLESDAINVFGRYHLSERVSFHGGVRFQRVNSRVKLRGQAYAQAFAVGGVAAQAGVDGQTLGAALQRVPEAVAALGGSDNVAALGANVEAVTLEFLQGGQDGVIGYEFRIDEEWGTGVMLGAAYEIPDIAFRASLTYFSEVSYGSDTFESLSPTVQSQSSTTDFSTPQAINLDIQSGVAPGTLVFAGLRWADYDDVSVFPDLLNAELVNEEDVYRWTLGAARQFTDDLVGLVAFSYEKEQGGPNTPLGPADGQIGMSIGGRYTRDNLTISGGVNYTWLGDVELEVGDVVVAEWEDNSALGVGLRVAYEF